jgi:hypothetical protein
MFSIFRQKKTNYKKIIFITLAVVLYVDWYNYLSKIIEKETIL